MKQKTKIILVVIAILCLFGSNRVILAQSTEEKIKDIREAVKEKVQETLKARARRGLAGIVKTVTAGALTLETAKGERLIILNEGTTFIKKENLKVGAYVIIIGDLNSDTSLEAKRVVVTTKPKFTVRKVVIGQVVDISAEENLLTLKNEKKNQVATIETKVTTVITKKDGDSVKKVTFKALTVGDWLVVVGTPAVSDDKCHRHSSAISVKPFQLLPRSPLLLRPRFDKIWYNGFTPEKRLSGV
jgi:hypothetical protein